MSISVGSVSVDVVPDTRTFAADLKAKLKGVVADIAVRADTAAVRAELDAVGRDRRVTLEVDADTSRAESQIDFAARDRNVGLNVGGIGAATAGISGLAAAVAVLGPALIPVTAAVAGLGAVLVAPLAAAGGGLTIGALIAGKAIADTKKQQKDIADLAKKVTAAKLTLEKASTPAGRRSAQLQLAADTKAYQAALAALTPAQKKFIDAQDKLKASFAGLVSSAGGAVFGPVIKGMDLLAGVLPKVKPLIVGVADGIGTLLDDLSSAASGPGFKAFVRSFGSLARDSIVSFGRIFGNVAKGLVAFFKGFGPLSKDFVGGLGRAARAFANWATNLGSSKSFQRFLAYVRDVGPKVAAAIGHVFEALGKVGPTLAPLGGFMLGFVDGIAKLIDTATPGQLAAIATGIGAIGVAVLFATGGVSGIIPALVGLGAGLTYAYNHSTKFRTAIQGLVGWFKDNLLPALKDAWKTVLPGLQSGFDSVKQSIDDNQGLFLVLRDVFKAIGKVIVDVVIPAVAQLYRVELPALGAAIGVEITALRIMANGWLLMAEAALQSFKILVVAATQTFGSILDAATIGLGWLPGIGPKILGAKKAFDQFRDNTVAALDVAIGKVKDLQTELNAVKPKTVKITLDFTQPPAKMVGGLPIFKPEGAGARGAIINRPTVALIGESGPERLTPLDQTAGNEPLPSGRSGAQFNIEQVVAQDVNDFLRQMQQRARHASLDGVPR